MSVWIIDTVGALPLPLPAMAVITLDRQAYAGMLHAAHLWGLISQHTAVLDVSLSAQDLGVEVRLVEVTPQVAEHLKRHRSERLPEGLPGVISHAEMSGMKNAATSVRLLAGDQGLRVVATYQATPVPPGLAEWDLTPDDFGAGGPLDVFTPPIPWSALEDMCRAHRPQQESQ